MVSFALASGAMVLVQGAHSFYFVRFLVGVAKAGFFPGILFFRMGRFPAAYRARMMSYFIIAVPLSFVIGAPASSLFLSMDGMLGIAGWKWLYIGDAIPALVMAVVIVRALQDKPADANWLPPDEKAWLAEQLASESAQAGSRVHGVLSALANRRVPLLSAIYFGAVASTFGNAFFLPTMVRGFGLSIRETGLVTALPCAAGAIGMAWWSKHSDRTGERKWHAVSSLVMAAIHGL